MAGQPGEKLGARLSQVMLRHNLALRSQLAPIEARIRAAGTQQVIDRAGQEVADLFGPLTRKLLESAPDMDPIARDFISRAASGHHQWQAMAGHLAMGSVQGGIGTVLTNYLAPAVYQIVGLDPQIHIDQEAAANAAAAGILAYSDAEGTAAQVGFTASSFAALYEMAQNVPAPPQIFDLMNRGIFDQAQARQWMQRNSVPPELIDIILQLRNVLLDPADAALAVLRGNMSQDQGYTAALLQGVSTGDFDILIGNTGEPPALEEMLMLHRRHKVDTPTLERAIRQSRVRDEWIPYILELEIEPPSQADVLNALVQGQIGQSEAQSRFAEAGGDPTWFQAAFDSTANSPPPVELAEMANRGIIPWTGTGPTAVSWQQGFLEGRWKDKWAPAYKAMAVYHPPPREIATLVREGGLTQNQAEKLWAEAGLPPDLINMYWEAAHYQRTTAIHQLAAAEIVKLYTDKAISRETAMSMLVSAGWTQTDANWQLDIADLKNERMLLEKAIGKIGALFTAWKITAQQAAAALASLEVTATQAEQEIAIWQLERTSNVKVLTAAEITNAWFYKLMSPQDAQAMLEQIGYTPYDAWLLLNIRNKGPIANYPQP
jgi:hypothetical protein